MTGMVVVMYHYVRDDAGFNAIRVDDFRRQVARLRDTHEMANLESALEFISGRYSPSKKLCLLTFDDAYAEHADVVTPVLAEAGIEGLFFFPTACVAEGFMLPAHQNHVLMAQLGFEEYRHRFLRRLEEPIELSPEDVAKTYRWDAPEVAAFKYLVNYALGREARERILNALFEEVVGDPREFASQFYVTWEKARAMRSAGMVIGSHTHRHPVLSSCTPEEQRDELSRSKLLLTENLGAQDNLPFCYPFGKPATYDAHTLTTLADLGYCCAFSTIVREAQPGDSRFEIPRLDTKDV